MISRKDWSWILGVVTLASLPRVGWCETQWSMSLRGVTLAEGERVVGFDLKFRAANIVAVPSVPRGWYIIVDNDSSGNTRLKGSVSVGAFAGDRDMLSDLVVVEKEEDDGVKFSVTGEVAVTRDFEKTRSIPVESKDVTLQERRSGKPRKAGRETR